MRKVPVDYVKPGMYLARSIVDSEGMILLRAVAREILGDTEWEPKRSSLARGWELADEKGKQMLKPDAKTDAKTNSQITPKRAAVAMSGGVDSAVAAALLKKEGWEVIGVTLRLMPGRQGIDDARRVAEYLNIPHRVLDCCSVFQEKVVNYFCGEYLRGRTPNPCVVCNPVIKFGVLLEKAREWGIDFLATGHYVRCAWDEERQSYLLLRGVDSRKDQSYFLYRLTQEQLAHVLFPLGERTKAEVRALAREWGLPVAEKGESQEICFVSGSSYAELVHDWNKENKGEIVPGPIFDRAGKYLGEHRGLIYYTVGQRRGLGVHAPHPLYVLELDKDRNALIVGKEEELYSPRLQAENIHFISPALIPSEEEWIQARIRSTARLARARVFLLGAQEAEVVFEQPQRAVTPGQAVVFYQGEAVLGGGVILK